MSVRQGKTNRKFLLIVFVLATIAGGGILWWQGTWEPPQQLEENGREKEFNLNEEFKINYDQTVLMRNENLKIKFSDVMEDSRCPSDVQCIWAGDVRIILSVYKDDNNLGNYNFTESSPIQNIDGYFIKLVSVNPYPISTEKIEKSEYSLTILVAKDETADWQTYRNEEYGFEVKYPADWKGGEKSPTTKIASFTPEERDMAQTGFWIYVYENPKRLSAEEWWRQEYKRGEDVYTYKGTFPIAGINAEVYKEESGLEFTYYLLPQDLKIFLILSPLVQEKIHQILSTFRFLE